MKLLSEAYVRQRSQELKIPFDQFLAAAVVEELIVRLAQSKYGEAMWLKNANCLSRESFRQRVNRNLEYYIKECNKLQYQKQEISLMYSELFRNYKKEPIYWNYSIRQEREIIVCNLIGTILAVKVPVKVTMRRISTKTLKAEEKELSLISVDNAVKVCWYPNERILVDRFIEIMEKLELVGDMSCYYEIFDILIREPLSGRQLWEILMQECEEHKIPVTRERIEKLMTYKNSTYMKKKWNTYLRHEKKTEPGWEEVMKLLESFFETIWNNMCENVIYLGDWIPELGRFID